jgi:hypothetical protein
MDKVTENFILKYSGFRRVGNSLGDLRIIRTTVDRPEISLIMCPIPRGDSKDPRQGWQSINEVPHIDQYIDQPVNPLNPHQQPGLPNSIHVNPQEGCQRVDR